MLHVFTCGIKTNKQNKRTSEYNRHREQTSSYQLGEKWSGARQKEKIKMYKLLLYKVSYKDTLYNL